MFALRQKSRRGLILLLVVVVAAAAGVWFAKPSDDPVCQGRPLSSWLEDLAAPPGSSTYENAAAAVRSIGTNAVPQLLRLLSTPHKARRDACVAFAHNRLRFRNVSWLPLSSDHWEMARHGFIVLGPSASNAVPALSALLDNSFSGWYASHSLSQMGPAALPA